ncbi:MAG TPA: phosphate ABC transporter permease subunit PstC [Bacteroidia bacterium]|nr:phosphate ABC transporter permease subunit PstC [Bacteroidia bacterium]
MSTRLAKDKTIKGVFLTLTLLSLFVVVLIIVGLYYKSAPILEKNSLWDMLSSDVWRPFKGKFGFLPFITGTLYVTLVAIVIALPLSLFTSIYLSEYAHKRVKQILNPLVDLLSGIPPVVYGVWGVLVVVPFIQDTLAPHFIDYSSGYSTLAGGIILAIMIFPLIINILGEVFSTIPQGLREASLSIGATKWQTVKYVVLKKGKHGIIAAVVLAISRAFGETIAVLMVCGNIPETPHSLFDGAYPLPALIANNYGEMLSIPMYDSALMLAALILFVIIFLFNAISRYILMRLERRTNG